MNNFEQALLDEWDDARCRLSGGKYGRRIVRAEEKRELVQAMLEKSRNSYERAARMRDAKKARALEWQVQILEAIAKDYAER